MLFELTMGPVVVAIDRGVFLGFGLFSRPGR